MVERIILDAHSNKLLFHVCVLDSPVERKGFFSAFFSLSYFIENHICLFKKVVFCFDVYFQEDS